MTTPSKGTLMIDFGVCPECGRELAVSFKKEGDPDAIAHGIPMCPAFEARTANAFLLYVMDVREAERRRVLGEG